MFNHSKNLIRKSAKKLVFIGLIILVIIAGVLVIGRQFKKEPTTAADNYSQVSATATTTPAVANTKLLNGIVEPPGSIAPESLTIVGLASTTGVDQQGNFSVTIYQDGVTAVAAMPEGKEFGLIKIVVNSPDQTADNFTINPTTTASGLVFMTPFFMTNDPARAKEILDIIDHDVKVQAFAQVITAVFDQADPLNDPSYQPAFKAAIQSVASTLNQ